MTTSNTSVKVTLDETLLDELARMAVETGLSRSALIRLFVVKAVQARKASPIPTPKEFTLDDYLS